MFVIWNRTYQNSISHFPGPDNFQFRRKCVPLYPACQHQSVVERFRRFLFEEEVCLDDVSQDILWVCYGTNVRRPETQSTNTQVRVQREARNTDDLTETLRDHRLSFKQIQVPSLPLVFFSCSSLFSLLSKVYYGSQFTACDKIFKDPYQSNSYVYGNIFE